MILVDRKEGLFPTCVWLPSRQGQLTDSLSEGLLPQNCIKKGSRNKIMFFYLRFYRDFEVNFPYTVLVILNTFYVKYCSILTQS